MRTMSVCRDPSSTCDAHGKGQTHCGRGAGYQDIPGRSGLIKLQKPPLVELDRDGSPESQLNVLELPAF